MTDDYLCLTLLSRPGEAQAAFAARLSAFWTRLLRERETLFEQVYAETTRFEGGGDRLSRQYLIAIPSAADLEAELRGASIDHEPLDRDDTFSKYEATAPDWMQIEH